MPEALDVRAYYARVTALDIVDVAHALLGDRIRKDERQLLLVDCPHHASISHTSLHIWRDRQGWYCHGCGVGGDVLQLVEFIQSGVVTRGQSGSMPETHRAARDWLAQRLGVPPLAQCGLSSDEVATLERDRAQTQRAWACLTAITRHYQTRLLAHSEALAWLEKQYAFDRQTVDDFAIGFAENEGLTAALYTQGFTLADLYACGAFRPAPQHDEIPLPVFEGRIMFPYRAKGHTVYLIGRKTPWTPEAPHEQGKYKKLPVHEEKSRPYIAPGIDNGVLYHEDLLTTRPEQVIITEGITDCITLLRHGFPAISPVTVSIRQADWQRLIPQLRGVPDIILCQDNEISEAGWKGALRTAHQLSLAHLACRVAVLPLDPPQGEARRRLSEEFGLQPGEGKAALDERLASRTPLERTTAHVLVEQAKQDVCGYFVSGHTAEAFRTVLAAAQSPIEYAITAIPEGGLTASLLTDIVSPILAQIAGLSTLEQTPLLKRLQAKLGKDLASLTELKHAMKEERQKRVKSPSHPRTPSDGTTEPPPMTDLGNAERLIQQHGEALLFCQTSREWLLWDSRRWAHDAQNGARRLAHETARSILQQEAAHAHDQESRDAWVRWQRASESARASGNMLTQATAYLTVPVHVFDTDPWLLNVLNGTLDLRTGVLHPHRQEDRLRKLAPVVYDPEAQAPTWGQFLYRIFDGDMAMIEYLQRAVGYTLSGDVACQCLFFMHGERGQNGKSTFVETMLHLLGEYAQRASTELLMRKQTGNSNVPNDLARLQGARMVVTSELDEGHRFSESRVKDLTGGDKITARFLYGEYFDFEPTHKLWIYGNHQPTASANDHGFWRRVHLIPFLVRIPDEEKDPDLKDKLKAQLPGIFAWAVRGCRLWLERRKQLDPPSCVLEATQQYRSDMDKLARFFAECCHVAQGIEVPAKRLYDRYVQWCDENHERAVSHTAFGRELTSRGFTQAKRRDSVYRLGIALRYEE
ncbi:MAG: phage/plasmid primase, P4 family [Armatimonadota bacterium]